MLGVIQIQLNSLFGYNNEFADDFNLAISSCSATGYIYTSPSAYVESSSKTAPSNSILTPICSNPYKVQPNDTCESIALA